MSTDGRQINKSAIRNFAIEARNILIRSAITEAGFYGITKEEIKSPIQRGRDFEVYETLTGAEKRIFDSDVKRRAALVEAIHQKGFDEVMEETAYTWFNRLIAIRFMEVNNYLPFRMRVLSSDSGSMTPDIVNKSLEVNLNLTEKELTEIQTAKDENNYDEAFRLLFIKTCNELNDILPGLFEKTDDYMELLLKLPYTSDGVVRMLVDTIPESNFNVNEGGQVEIIGWLYQYYNTEPKAKAFAKKGKITKEEIPAVTQLFTPDWIVRYMVENSLGRLWVEHLLANGDNRSEQEIANDFGWKYYLPEAEQEPEVQAQLLRIREDRKNLTPEDILCIDPCQGSGHILVYLFEVLMQIYQEDGYSARDAARCILEHNLYGLDIDDRAYQLAYFAVLMKARQYDRMILKKHIQPHIYSIQESNSVNRNQLKYLGTSMNGIERNNAVEQLTGLLDTFRDAKEYGSILNVDYCDWDLLRRFVENDRIEGQLDFEVFDIDYTRKKLLALIEIGKVMAQKYNVVTTNPPYMSSSSMNEKLLKYVKDNYAYGKDDLFSCFIERIIPWICKNGFCSLMTSYTWMFLTGATRLRKYVLDRTAIQSLIQPEYHAFFQDANVPICTFVLRVIDINYIGDYIRLSNFYGADIQEIKAIEAISNPACKWRYSMARDMFKKIPGLPFAYWIPIKTIDLFVNTPLMSTIADMKQGLITGDNDRFLRFWYECEQRKITTSTQNPQKWFFYHKGGEYRKWYGNISLVVNWENKGAEIINFRDAKGKQKSRPQNVQYYFKEGFTWTALTVADFNVRYMPSDAIFDAKGSSGFVKNKDYLYYVMALCNSKVAMVFLSFLAPTMDYSAGSVGKVPIIIDDTKISEITTLVKECISSSKDDWNSFETSWDFKRHPLVSSTRCAYHGGTIITIEQAFSAWKNISDGRFEKLKNNEERLNQLFISIYRLNNDLIPMVEDRYITIRKAELQRDVKSLISYAVGCMFGRYSLDVDGLTFAGGDWKKKYTTKYKTFIPDEDAIIPITDEEYFKDDIVARFVDFIRIVYGKEMLEENLSFIANALGNKGDTPRIVIRNYFLEGFYKDHCKYYQKRPIYWLFDSGRQNGFKALIYIHRYTPDTVGLIRSVYLHNAQAAIQNSLQNSEYIISTTTSANERARETKKKNKYMKQLNELHSYYQALSHIALQRIPMDLDNGVKKNYQLFQGVEVSTEGKKKQTIDLLAKL